MWPNVHTKASLEPDGSKQTQVKVIWILTHEKSVHPLTLLPIICNTQYRQIHLLVLLLNINEQLSICRIGTGSPPPSRRIR